MPLVLRTVFALRQTAEEQSAAFALISELLDANALDYHAAGNSLRAAWLAFSGEPDTRLVKQGQQFYLKRTSNKAILHAVTASATVADPFYVFLVAFI